MFHTIPTPGPGARARLRRAIAACVGLTLAIAWGLAAPAATAATATPPAPYCGIAWGSSFKGDGGNDNSWITNIRSGRHECFDRMVVDVKGKVTAYTVGYVPVLRADGSGMAVPLRGGAFLQIFLGAADYNPYLEEPVPTYRPANSDEATNVTGYRTFRQIKTLGSFEGDTEIGLGVRARLPFRVFVLDDGATSRLVIDVAHRW